MSDMDSVPRKPRPAEGFGRVALSGASGLVGGALAASLESGGNPVIRLVRREPAPGGTEVAWDPAAGNIDGAGLEGLDGLVHLAGENIAAGRWTAARKERIRASRVRGTLTIAKALAGLKRPPRVLVNASAIGFYGNRGDDWVDETSSRGTGFLSETCAAWEEAVAPAAEAGIRVVRLRIGIVLSAEGGALQRMLPVFRLGLGGRMGDGRQYMSWIVLEDLVRVIEHALRDESLSGAVNAVAPAPVTNAEFARTLAAVLGRPALLPVPAFAIRVLLGEMGRELLLSSTRVRNARLHQSGFRFRLDDLESGLRAVLGKESPAS